MQRSAKRPYQISLRLSEREAKMFDKVAEKHSLPVSGMIRMLVAGEAYDLGVELTTREGAS